jgi:hypothetical protein
MRGAPTSSGGLHQKRDLVPATSRGTETVMKVRQFERSIHIDVTLPHEFQVAFLGDTNDVVSRTVTFHETALGRF